MGYETDHEWNGTAAKYMGEAALAAPAGLAVVLSVDRDRRTGALQLCIGDRDGGYRIAGPKYNGRGETLLKATLTMHDAEAIRRYLDAAFPPNTELRDAGRGASE